MKLKLLPLCAMFFLVGCGAKPAPVTPVTPDEPDVVEPTEPVEPEEPVEPIEPEEPEEPEIITYTLDFTTLTADKSSAFTAETMLEVLDKDVVASVTGVDSTYLGAGSGGCHADEFGVVKMGTSKKHGTFTLNLVDTIEISKVTVNCHDFYAKSDQYPTNSNKLSINGVEKLVPYNETGAGENLEFEFETPIKTISFDSNLRVYLFSITLQ